MLFCQHKHNTWNKLGKDWLNIHDTPHYRHLLGGDDYREYLKLSWKGRQDKIEQKIRTFDNLHKNIKQNGIKKPIDVVKRLNGDKMVFHGNHRYAIARHLGIEFETRELPITDYLRFNISNGQQFGTNERGIPYQSLWYKGECLIEGRRIDQLDRHALIDPADLKGKRVYDFGCNLGASAILAHEAGATVEGWDLPKFRTAAIRIALLMNYDIQYRPAKGEYDTLFLFSVTRKTQVPDINAKVIYLELNIEDELPDCFTDSEFLGKVGSQWKMYRYDNAQNRS